MKSSQITDFFKPRSGSIKKVETNSQYHEEEASQTKNTKKISMETQELQIENLISPFPEFTQGLASWLSPLQAFVKGKVFRQIYQFIEKEYKTKTIYPKKEDIFNAFRLTPLSHIKAVIVGQDPYHGPNQAHGLCFSVLRPVRPPKSLINIYKSLQTDPLIKNFKKPTHGDLTSWAKQGVLMINATLTVQQGKANSHADCGWQKFTDNVIKIIDQNCQGIVFFLWGSFAQAKGANINKKKHLILKTTHPSPFSADKGFLTANHFSKCNQYLVSTGKTPIDWNVD